MIDSAVHRLTLHLKTYLRLTVHKILLGQSVHRQGNKTALRTEFDAHSSPGVFFNNNTVLNGLIDSAIGLLSLICPDVYLFLGPAAYQKLLHRDELIAAKTQTVVQSAKL